MRDNGYAAFASDNAVADRQGLGLHTEAVLSAGAYCRVGVSSAVAAVGANPDAAIAAIAVLRISCAPRHIYSANKTAFFYDQTHIAGLAERSISFCLMKNHEWKALGRVIYGSRKTAFFEKKANFAARTGRRIEQIASV
jgi:hypothetical protein